MNDYFLNILNLISLNDTFPLNNLGTDRELKMTMVQEHKQSNIITFFIPLDKSVYTSIKVKEEYCPSNTIKEHTIDSTFLEQHKGEFDRIAENFTNKKTGDAYYDSPTQNAISLKNDYSSVDISAGFFPKPADISLYIIRTNFPQNILNLTISFNC